MNFYYYVRKLLFASVMVMFIMVSYYGYSKATVVKISKTEIFGPVPIKWGQDRCVKCNMKILKKNEIFATEIGNPITREVYMFDSPGCAVAWLYVIHKFSWTNDAKIWVIDSVTHKWIDAKKAYWRIGPPEADPMHYGLVATTIKSNDSFDWEKAKSMLINSVQKRMKSMKMENSKTKKEK